MSLPTRCLVLGVCLGSGCAFGQMSALPATRPTSDTLPVAVPASSLSTADRASHRAEVVFSGGLLKVTASNSSLNQILREVARQTGIKITGGVHDERVFGKFGPSTPSDVLASLLDGTDSNVMLHESSPSSPAELILTARGGGPTPPNPNAAGYDDDPQTPDSALSAAPETSAPAVVQQPGPQPLPVSAPIPTPAITSTQQTPQTPPPGGIVEPPTVAPATEPGTTPGPATQTTGTSDPPSTDAKTPQQIYLQLQQLQQQQAAPK